MVWLDRMLHSEDTLYWMSIHALWGIDEMGAGFLILGIPSLPKVFQMLPFSESVAKPLWPVTNGSLPKSFNTIGWRKPMSRKRRGLWEISELESHSLCR